MRTFSIATLLICLLNSFCFAQKGQLSGKVTDAKTGEEMIGAAVIVDGTSTGAVTDLEGKYTFSIEPGVYTIKVTLIGYLSQTIKDVNVTAGKTEVINISIQSGEATNMAEVEVTAKAVQHSEGGVLLLQKNNVSVSDVISSVAISKTPDKTTSDVLKRVSGASIQDNKFAVIRGMNDRYNAAYLNGAPLPSSESDRKAFAFDIFPSNLLDNLIIVKTATPDLPGEFAGGVIQVNTKSIPEKSQRTISLSTGYNNLSTFKDFRTYQGGKTDFLGIDDGTRAMPSQIPSTEDFKTMDRDQKAQLGKATAGDWSLLTQKAQMPFSLQYTMANVGKVMHRKAGSVLGITYNTSNTIATVNRRDYEQGIDVMKRIDLEDKIYTTSVLTSALWNLSYNLNDNNQLGFKNLLSVNSDDKVTERQGARDLAILQWEKANVRWFTQNKLYSGQLTGDHVLPKSGIKIKWTGGLSDIARDIPNMRRQVSRKQGVTEDDESKKYYAVIQNNGVTAQTSGTMFFSNTKERIYSGRYDVSKSLKIGNTKHELKVGGFHQLRDREFNARLLGYSAYTKGSQIKISDSLLSLPEEQMFQAQNFGLLPIKGPYNGGFKLEDGSKSSDSYTASSTLHAGYVMADSKVWSDQLRFIYGVRVESYKQQFHSRMASTDEEVNIDTTVVDLLPSLNIVYSPAEKVNIRASYYRTVSRPEFRELAPFGFYDFINDFTVFGNPSLKRALIDNYDLRLEWFPGGGQVISVSGFYKQIQQAIEQISLGSNRQLSYANVASVSNLGAEFEYKVKLSTVLQSQHKIADNLSLYTNLSFVKSVVDVGQIMGAGANAGKRPMQGQSPVIINGGLQYQDTEKGFSANASYNFVGKRIFIVGDENEPSYWENPRHVLDFQVAKTIGQLELKINLKDVLAQDAIFYQDINNNHKLDKNALLVAKNESHSLGTDNIMVKMKMPRTLSFSVTYKF